MASLDHYALLASRVYFDGRSLQNKPFVPDGWRELTLIGPLASGFQAGVYTNGSEIVIAFGGTSGTDILNSQNARADWINNLQLGFGFAGEQLYEAVRLYAQVRRGDFGTGNLPISFTGDSLGGGLASVLTGLFGLPSKVFETAPFQPAFNADNVQRLADDLAGRGFTQDAAQLQSLLYTVRADSGEHLELDMQKVLARESLVSHWAINGEVLGSWRLGLNTFADPFVNPINVGATEATAVDLHSISLHLAALGSDPFRLASQRLPALLKWVLDKNLYAQDLGRSRELDFLERLIRNQFAYAEPGYTSPVRMLDSFGEDMQRLGVTGGLAAQQAMRDALIATGIEYYNFLQPAQLADFFNSVPGGIRFDLDTINLARSDQKGYARLRDFVTQTYGPQLPDPSLLALDTRRQWFVQAGDSGMVAKSTGDVADAMLGGEAIDGLGGGDGDDLLIGGAGGDVFEGGKGNDLLVGGTGTDTYYYRAGDGLDTIADADKLGRIVYIDADGKSHILHGGTALRAMAVPTPTKPAVSPTPRTAHPQHYSRRRRRLTLQNFTGDSLHIALRERATPLPDRGDPRHRLRRRHRERGPERRRPKRPQGPDRHYRSRAHSGARRKRHRQW